MAATGYTCCCHLIVNPYLASDRNNAQSSFVPRTWIVKKLELFITDENKSYVALSFVLLFVLLLAIIQILCSNMLLSQMLETM